MCIVLYHFEFDHLQGTSLSASLSEALQVRKTLKEKATFEARARRRKTTGEGGGEDSTGGSPFHKEGPIHNRDLDFSACSDYTNSVSRSNVLIDGGRYRLLSRLQKAHI